METVRVLVADDHPLFRDGLRALLASVPDVELVGEAGTGDEAIRLAAELEPDAILMDIQMPDKNGIEATRSILKVNPDIGVIVLTMFEDDDSVFSAMRAGARGYILKGANQTDLLRAIRSVAAGEALFGPAIAQRLITYFAASSRSVQPPAFPDLTEREREILTLIAQGRNNTEIADQLFISPKTVRNHISSIFSKLQVADRAQAIVRAREAGLGLQPKG